MVNLWSIYGQFMVNLWSIYGQFMVNLWSILWSIYGQFIVSLFIYINNAIDTWLKFRATNFDPHLQSIFKLRSNHIVWNQINEIVTSLNLKLQLIYVKAHSSDPWNEFIDSKCSEVHNNNNSSIITLLTDNMKNIHYTLNWNNIEVEQSSRKFISQRLKLEVLKNFLILHEMSNIVVLTLIGNQHLKFCLVIIPPILPLSNLLERKLKNLNF
ncbi:hypothetical protein RirG_224160 [Rhizophagus irregularis DAOM 197198w]|uniref:RNase H type-1 domain-containing protein n=1 Tax=Rhizophagus irregularis (strain DAOM 197198w) TaxID=1432141 RepID=A0A015K7Y4_RHIIW|nr:hypothetical protein RirG_224160 [Rhizophagus irregularis DAOM 197198w]